MKLRTRRFHPLFMAMLALVAAMALLARPASDAAPDRVILMPTEDPSTSAAVAWRSGPEGTPGKAQIAEAPPGPAIEERASTVDATPHALKVGDATLYHQSVVFRNLKPETAYVYRVGDGSSWSEWHQFSTASARAKPFRFIYVGDAQTDILGRCSRAFRQALRDCPDARLVLHGGDLTNTASSDREWGEWFAMAGWADASILNVPAIGNHQYERVDPNRDERRLTLHWRAQFALPENGVPGLEESCYWFDYQGVRFIVLNSMEKIAEQSAWLERLLSANPCRWTIVMLHHPIFSGAKNRDNKEIRESWKPIFDRFGVDLVLTGHDHVYGRSDPRRGPARGHTIYVTSVLGAKQYDAGSREWAARFGQDLQLYQIIAIDGSTLRYEARTAEGRPYDAFTIRKTGRGGVFQDGSRTLGTEKLRPVKKVS